MKIEEGKHVIPCCVGSTDCDFKAGLTIIRELVPSHLQHYMRNRAQADFNYVCVSCSSSEFRLARFDNSKSNSSQYICRKCDTSYCLFCRERVSFSGSLCRRPKLSCSSNASEHYRHMCSDPKIQKLAEHVLNPTNMIRPCPHCFKLVHRFEGCPNMRCDGVAGCQKAWCWSCLSPCNHSGSDCLVYLHPPTGTSRAMDAVKRTGRLGLKVVATAVIVPVIGVRRVLSVPIVAYNRYLARLEYMRMSTLERIARNGIDVYVVPDGVPNAPNDPLDDADAVAFVRRFAVESNGHGRWLDEGVELGYPENRCYLAYGCLNGRALVRVHPHGENDARCALHQHQPQLSSYENPIKVRIDDIVTIGAAETRNSLRRRSVKSAFDVVNEKCALTLRKLGVNCRSSMVFTV